MAVRVLSLLLATVALASIACRADTAYDPLASEPETTAVVPQNPADQNLRRDLNLAIDRDPTLKDRGISFVVSNGDISVTGLVRTEDERERINGLAMGIPGVKSVANALRVSP